VFAMNLIGIPVDLAELAKDWQALPNSDFRDIFA
jgi:hypothetical protein